VVAANEVERRGVRGGEFYVGGMGEGGAGFGDLVVEGGEGGEEAVPAEGAEGEDAAEGGAEEGEFLGEPGAAVVAFGGGGFVGGWGAADWGGDAGSKELEAVVYRDRAGLGG